MCFVGVYWTDGYLDRFSSQNGLQIFTLTWLLLFFANGNVVCLLGIIGLVDEGETDWKVIGIRADDSEFDKLTTIDDATRVFGTDFESMIIDWFRNYKVPDGKPQNSFTHDAKTQSPEMAVNVIEECHKHWYALMLGATDSDLSKESVTYKHMVATGLTSSTKMEDFPRIAYPKFENWHARPMDRLDEVDEAYEEYELGEETPDERKQ